MEAVRGVLARAGTWDLLRLRAGGELLKGDYQGCRYIALDRQETDTLEFSGANKTLTPDSLWALLGQTPQVKTKPRWWPKNQRHIMCVCVCVRFSSIMLSNVHYTFVQYTQHQQVAV